ncbi:MAG: hypothetical protein R3B72_23965 [Polyangiaceae bacterium]
MRSTTTQASRTASQALQAAPTRGRFEVEDGCGCRLAERPSGSAWWWLAIAGVGLFVVSLRLDGDSIPKKSAVNFHDEYRGAKPLVHRFRLDEGDYQLELRLDDSEAALTYPLHIDSAGIALAVTSSGDELHVE